MLLCAHFAITLLLSFVTQEKRDSHSEKLLFALVVFLFCVLVAVRPDRNIPDVDAYRSRYYSGFHDTSIQRILSLGLLRKSEVYYMNILPSFLTYIFSSAGISFEIFSFVLALTETLVVLKCVAGMLEIWGYKYNLFRVFVMFMAFYGYHYLFIATAQGLAMMFIFLSLYQWIRQKRILAVFSVILAILCHAAGLAGIVILAVYTLSKRYSNRTYTALWLVSLFVMITGLGALFSGFTKTVVSRIVNIATTFYSEYEQYGDAPETAARASLISILICFLSKFIMSADTDRKEYWKLANIFFISIVAGAFFGSWEILGRFTDVFLAFIIPIACMCVYERSFTLVSAGERKITLKDGEVLAVNLLCVTKFLSFLYILINYTRLKA